MHEMMTGMPMEGSGWLVMLITAAIVVVPFWFIFKKTGHPAWLSVLMVVPLVNLILLYFLAFSDWPRLREG